MAKGRKAVPVQIHRLKGTFDKSRHREPVGSENRDPVMVAPDYLSTRAREIFNSLYLIISNLGYADNSHSSMLALTAVTIEEVEILTEAIRDKPLSYQTQSVAGEKVWKALPQVKQRADAIRRAQSLLAESGLSAASMGKVAAISKQDTIDPFSKF